MAIGEQAITRPIQIHDVQPACTHGMVALQQGERIDLVAGLVGKIALEQPHAAAAPQINGGDQLHALELQEIA